MAHASRRLPYNAALLEEPTLQWRTPRGAYPTMPPSSRSLLYNAALQLAPSHLCSPPIGGSRPILEQRKTMLSSGFEPTSYSAQNGSLYDSIRFFFPQKPSPASFSSSLFLVHTGRRSPCSPELGRDAAFGVIGDIGAAAPTFEASCGPTLA